MSKAETKEEEEVVSIDAPKCESSFSVPGANNNTQTTRQVSEEDDSMEEDNGTPPSSQQYGLSQLSQTDEHIRLLEREGELEQVVGSQSMLSQELIHSSQATLSAEQDEGEDEPTFQLSQPAEESSTAMARRLGLLSQEEKTVAKVEESAASAPEDAREEVRDDKFAHDKEQPDMKSPPPGSKKEVISDTPFRDSECFGSLLEAVEKITREEEIMSSKLVAWQHNTATTEAAQEKKPAPKTPPKRATSGRQSKLKRKSKSPTSITKNSSPTKKARKANICRDSEERKEREIAKRAAALAGQMISDPDLAKNLLLSMALCRTNPRAPPQQLPRRGAVIPEGFFWAHYPPLEAVLKEHMAKYYDLSTTKCQSAVQQAFNNDLVVFVRDVAEGRGWKFHKCFSDKCLRDRIRCYYKTHIQNAKKRLRTMVRNPTKRANARHLCAHLDLIEQHKDKIELTEEDTDEEEKSLPEKKVASKRKKVECRQVSRRPSPGSGDKLPAPGVTMEPEQVAEV